MEQVVLNWIEQHIDQVAPRNPVGNHIDEITDTPLEGVEALHVSLQALAPLIRHLAVRDFPVQPILVVPLLYGTSRLAAACPSNLPEVYQNLHGSEPPSLYMQHWEAGIFLDPQEEYKRPLSFSLLEPPITGLYTYYRESRTLDELRDGWEFARCIYLAYYPARYRFTV